MSKWFSRKLLVSIIAVGAIVWGIHSGNENAETQINATGMIVADAAIALIGAVYVIIQGSADKKKAE